MNAIPTVMVNDQKNTEVVHEGDDGLVELGSVTSETKGGFFGNTPDGGNGVMMP